MEKNIMKKVYIIVLNYNNWRDTIKCVESVLNLDYKYYQVVIVDNNSSDDSIMQIENFISNQNHDIFKEDDLSKSNKKIIFIKAKENKGYSAGNNIGIKFAKLNGYDFVWILNNDTVVKYDSLKKFVNCALNSEKNVGIWGNPIYYYGTNFLQGIGCKFNKFIAQGGTIGYKAKDLKKTCLKTDKVRRFRAGRFANRWLLFQGRGRRQGILPKPGVHFPANHPAWDVLLTSDNQL